MGTSSDRGLFEALWPEYNLHGSHAALYFGSLFPGLPNFRHCSSIEDERVDRTGAHDSILVGSQT